MKYLLFILIGFVLGVGVNSVYAITKYESGNYDAQSIVGYGYNGTTLVPILVDSSGVVQLH